MSKDRTCKLHINFSKAAIPVPADEYRALVEDRYALNLLLMTTNRGGLVDRDLERAIRALRAKPKLYGIEKGEQPNAK